MDKQRHPNVIRTWTVERTKIRYPSPPPVKLRPRSEGSVPGQESSPIRPLRPPKGGQ